jgi:hypothetical protein
MWNGIWEKIKTKSVTPHKSHPKAIKNDMVDIVLSMPADVYSVFRVQLDAPHTLRSRRASDQEEAPGAPAPV